MQVEKVQQVVINPTEEEKEMCAKLIENLDKIETAIDGDCKSCPFKKSCERFVADDVCYIHATGLMLAKMAKLLD